MAIGNFDLHPNGVFRRPSASVNGRAIAANVAESIDIPDLAKLVILTGTVDIFFSMSGTAAVPTDSDAEGQSPCIPAGVPIDSRSFIIPDGSTAISVITNVAAGGVVSAEFFVGS